MQRVENVEQFEFQLHEPLEEVPAEGGRRPRRSRVPEASDAQLEKESQSLRDMAAWASAFKKGG